MMIGRHKWMQSACFLEAMEDEKKQMDLSSDLMHDEFVLFSVCGTGQLTIGS